MTNKHQTIYLDDPSTHAFQYNNTKFWMNALNLLVSTWICIAQCAFLAESGPSSITTAENFYHLPRGPFHPKDPAKLQAELLTADALESLQRGRSYYMIHEIDDFSGTGFLIQDVHAPPSTVWEILREFDEYPKRIPKLSACQTYQVTEQARRTMLWYTEMTIAYRLSPVKKVMTGYYRLVSLNFFVKNEYHPKENVMMWTLDEANGRESDLVTSEGYWYVQAHPINEGWSRVTYHIHFAAQLDGIPAFALKFITQKAALKEATTWVKTFSEGRYKRERRRRVLLHADVIGKPKIPPGIGNDMDEIEKANPPSSAWFRLPTPHHPLPASIGFSRYFLVSSVTGLLFFNIYLYFSHYR